MATPYQRYLNKIQSRSDNDLYQSTQQNVYKGYNRGPYDPISAAAGLKFVGSFVAIIVLISLCSWLKTKWNEKKWAKEWDKKKHQKELEEREKNSEGINPFGWEGNKRKGKTISNETKGSLLSEYRKLHSPDEVAVEVRAAGGKIISGKKIKSKIQLLELTKVLGLSFPEGCTITIKTKIKKSGDDKGV
jgi:hypothetical protein